MISAATHEGLDLLLEALWLEVENARQQTVDDAEAAKDAPEPDREYTYEAPFQITRIPEGFEIEGRRPIQAVQMTDFENEQAIEHLQHRLKKMGVFKALKRMGAQPGQTVRISGVDLDYQPD